MDANLYSTLENMSKKLAELKQEHISIGAALLPIYDETIKTKKDLSKYIYSCDTCTLDGINIEETTKAYFNYFEDMYSDSEFFAANALVTSREYEHFKDFPEIHNIYRKFVFDFYFNKFVLKENQSKSIDYNIPLWYMPVFAAFIRVLYSKKKLDKISAAQFLESISAEIQKVVFQNFSMIYSIDTDLGKPDTLKLLYRYNIAILYEINAMYIGSTDPVILPYIPSINGFYHTCTIQFRQSAYHSLFVHIIELYWKSIWKPLTEKCTFQTVQTNYAYDTKPLSVCLTDKETDDFINNRLLDKSYSRFNTVSDAFDKIDSCVKKCTSNDDLNKCLEKIEKITESYLSKIKDYDKDTISPLVDQIYSKLEQLALSRKDIIICHADKETMYADYSRVFHNIWGIYDMAAIAIKYILRNKSLPDKNKYVLLKTQILPQLAERDKADCFNRFRMEYINFHHNLEIFNISPKSFQTDLQEMQQLFSIFQNGCYPKDKEDEELCGQFDRLVENIISLCPDSDNCFSYIFQILTGDM